MRDVIFLSRDEMKGRGNGSPELDQAADYIADQFKRAGLAPAGENGTYFQPFEITTEVQFGPRNRLEIDGGALQIDQDFAPIAFSDTASVAGEMVFAGYGVSASDLH